MLIKYQIVDEKSGRLLYGEIFASAHLNATHRGLCRFSQTSDNGDPLFQTVAGVLRRLAASLRQ